MVAADAPVRWPTLCTKVGPQRLTSEIHDLQGRDLAAQTMAADCRLILLLKCGREIAQQLFLQPWIVGQVGGEDFLVEVDLGVGQQHAELGPRQWLAIGAIGPHGHRIRQELHGTVEPALVLQRAHESFETIMLLRRLPLGHADRLALLIIVTKNKPCPSWVMENRRASRSEATRAPAAIAPPVAILMLTSWSEVSTPAELSSASVLIWAAGEGCFDPAALGKAKVGAFADYLRANLRSIDA